MRQNLTSRVLLAVLAAACVALPASGKEKAPKKAAPEPLGESLCPDTISVDQRATAVPDGWEAKSSGATPQLAMVTFYDGPPAERASLKYDSELKQKQNWIATWTLVPGARGYWIECAYVNTTAVLTRRLPAEARTCTVTYERKERTTAGLPAVKHVGCK